jgi:hypothetical protein
MFEEVKEMIDSTIYTNGRGEVTAQNINLAMHGMVDATEEKFSEVGDAVKAVEDKVTALEENGTAAPSGPLRVWINEGLTDKQKSENAAAHAAIKNGETNVQILFDYGDGFYEIYELRSIAVMDGLVGFIVSVGINEEHFYETDSYILNEDGTVFIPE